MHGEWDLVCLSLNPSDGCMDFKLAESTGIALNSVSLGGYPPKSSENWQFIMNSDEILK